VDRCDHHDAFVTGTLSLTRRRKLEAEMGRARQIAGIGLTVGSAYRQAVGSTFWLHPLSRTSSFTELLGAIVLMLLARSRASLTSGR
jgi:hypothetical protein